MLLSWT